ncbi:MAG: ABC transporter permease [Gammaproteobacteria bacterium]|nr:ABC transporter permease [Gammaproteobacteria bacterium]MDE2345517.1 ABC transporter permease [Gammaproteobacteria bacterium]
MADAETSVISSLLGWTGRRSLRIGAYLLDLTSFIISALRERGDQRRYFNRANLDTLMTQIIFTGVDALPVVTLLALAVGISITSQILDLGQALGSEHDVELMLVKIIGTELSPLLTSIVIIGRSGSAITVDMGLMQVRGEIEGLMLLGININHFFVSPRILGAAISQLALAIYFAAIAMFGGVLLAGLIFSTQYSHEVMRLIAVVQPSQFLIFVLKNLLFGMIIAGTACFHGLRVHTSPTELPQQTQRAIVTSLVLVFLVDGLLAIITQ